MKIELVQTKQTTDFAASTQFMERQQNIDAILVLAKIMEIPGMEAKILIKVSDKISNLIEKI